MTEVVVVVAAAVVVVVDDNAATVVENYFLANCDKFLNDCRHVKPAKNTWSNILVHVYFTLY